MNIDRSYVKIDIDAICANYRAIAKKAGVPVMAIIKANAYGHGAVQLARALQDQCSFFGVATVSEALELRYAGIKDPILILGHTPASAFPLIVEYGIRPAIFRYDDALALSQEACRQQVAAPFHFAVDTGMHRIGFCADEASADVCAKIAALPGLIAEGLFSHFATADAEDLTYTYAQAAAFDAFDQMLRSRGVHIPMRHLDNSAGLMNLEHHYDMVRAGIILYGLYPNQKPNPNLTELRPALSWHSTVSYIKWLAPGQPISYGCTFVTSRDTLVATIPVGYADGYRRNLSNRFHVLIGGMQAPILGRICMDQLMVDVTHIPNVCIGDSVVLIGTDGEASIPVEQIAANADSFNYEFVCGISRRIPRVFFRNGKAVETVDYLL